MKKSFPFLLLGIAVLIPIFFWYKESGEMFSNGIYGISLAIGRLTGLLATFCALLQLVLIGRVKWVESLFGFDRLSRLHHWNGILTFFFLILHPFFVTTAYGGFGGVSFLTQTNDFIFRWSEMMQTYIALILFIGLIILSLTIVKKKLKYEWWYFTHLGMYLAIVLAFGHQIDKGGDFQNSALFAGYWDVLYLFVFGNLLYYRFFIPIFHFWKFRFFVDHIVRENDSCTSLYIGGSRLDEFRIAPGQFFIFRFLSPKFFLEAHPYSLSIAPNGSMIRITVKNLGDFSGRISEVPLHTSVFIDGPHGIFTPEVCRKEKILFLAGGIGITPIRSLIEYFVGKKDMVLLWGNNKKENIVFDNEFESFPKNGLRIFHVLSNDSTWNGECGFVDKEKILRLVPDVREREVYLCGPLPMMRNTLKILREIGVSNEYIHYERFSL